MGRQPGVELPITCSASASAIRAARPQLPLTGRRSPAGRRQRCGVRKRRAAGRRASPAMSPHVQAVPPSTDRLDTATAPSYAARYRAMRLLAAGASNGPRTAQASRAASCASRGVGARRGPGRLSNLPGTVLGRELRFEAVCGDDARSPRNWATRTPMRSSRSSATTRTTSRRSSRAVADYCIDAIAGSEPAST